MAFAEAGYALTGPSTNTVTGLSVLHLEFATKDPGRFTGSVWSVNGFAGAASQTGCVPNQHNCGRDDLETDDLVVAPVDISGGQRIDFDCHAGGGDTDGINVASTSNLFYLDLFIDGSRDPARVVYLDENGIGAAPPAVPFAITQP